MGAADTMSSASCSLGATLAAWHISLAAAVVQAPSHPRNSSTGKYTPLLLALWRELRHSSNGPMRDGTGPTRWRCRLSPGPGVLSLSLPLAMKASVSVRPSARVSARGFVCISDFVGCRLRRSELENARDVDAGQLAWEFRGAFGVVDAFAQLRGF